MHSCLQNGAKMALDGITTLLATSTVPNAEQDNIGDLDQIPGLTVEGDTVTFDEELLGFLAPLVNNSTSPTGGLTAVSDSAIDESTSELEVFDTIAEPQSFDLGDGFHFEAAFASTFPVNPESVQAVVEQPDVDAAALPTAATVAEAAATINPAVTPDSAIATAKAPTESTIKSIVDSSPDAQTNDGLTNTESTGVQAKAVDETSSNGSESDGSSEGDTTEQPANRVVDSSAVDSLEEPAADAATNTAVVADSASDLTGIDPTNTDDVLDTPDQPDAPVAIANADTTPISVAVPLQVSSGSAAFADADTTVVDAPNLAEQIASEAVKHAEIVKHQGQQRFTMRLDPPELGKLVVEMERTDKGLTMRVNAVDPATLGLIQTSLEELNSNLSQQDSVFQEMNIDVTTGGASEESFNDRSSERSIGENKQHVLAEDDGAPKATTAIDKSVSFVA